MSNSPFSIRLDKIASKKALDFFKNFPQKMKEANEIALFRIGTEVRTDGATKAPFKSGTLRRSLTSRSDKDAIFEEKKNRVEVGTKLVYARAQEYGYKGIRAKKYMTQAMDTQKSGRAEKIFREEIETATE